MHEVELGVWKALFIHLIRILESIDGGLVTELDHRSVSLYTCRPLYDMIIVIGRYHRLERTRSAVSQEIAPK